MQIIKKEYKVYAFDELSKNAKDTAREKNLQEENYPFLEEDLKEQLKEELKENEIQGEPEIDYSLSYCQGDGLMFTGSFYWKGLSIVIDKSRNGNYSHSYMSIFNIINEKEEEIESEEFEDLYHEICRKIERIGYDIIETQQSEENFADLCNANDYTFLESGAMFNN